MTVKELRQALDGLPDEMLVGGSGHFGEMLECYYAEPMEVLVLLPGPGFNRSNEVIFVIGLEPAGADPD